MMRPYRLRQDLTRERLGEFALPLGILPVDLPAPRQGYTVTYTPGENDLPDSYAFHIVVSHERLRDVIGRAFGLLPMNVFGIVEIGSRDAYRTTDTYIGDTPLEQSSFIEVWKVFEAFLIEDCSIGAGANSEEPFVEVFVDQWKGVSIHVELTRRDEVEAMLAELGLEEVPHTWDDADAEGLKGGSSELRSVLDLSDDFSPDVDELLLQLRHAWQLSLDIDPESNEDEAGRELGMTLWHVVVIVESREDEDAGAYVSIWMTAASAKEVSELVDGVFADQPQWGVIDLYSIDRVAFDDRPDALAALPMLPKDLKVHLVEFERWTSTPIAER